MGSEVLGNVFAEGIGPYRVLSELGAGGMGTVYLAEAGEGAGAPLGQRVALKVIHPHLLSNADLFDRFRREAEIGFQIAHENVVRTLDTGSTLLNGVTAHYLVLEYVEGQTLGELRDELETVPEELCRHIGREIALALIAIHAAGAVHRDLKPDNVLITRDHGIKVMDLGLVAIQDEAVKLSQTGQFIGTLLYASPEQFMGGEKIDGRADLYALGLILYELATGRHPFRDDDINVVITKQLQGEARRIGELNPKLSPFIEELVVQLIAKGRDDRVQTARALLDILVAGEKGTWWEQRSGEIRAGTRRPLRRMRVPRDTALYGRAAPLGRLRRSYDAAKAGNGQVVILEGEAGSGKTRLVDEFVGMLHREGEDIDFLFGEYPPSGAATPFSAFTTAFREYIGGANLETALAEYLPKTPVLVPAFAAMLAGAPPPAGAEPLTKENVQTVFAETTRSLAAQRPAIILIDDLHFSPDDGRALFTALALAIRDHPVLLIGTARRAISTEWLAELERFEHVRRVPVERLGPKDLQELLREALGSARLAEHLSAKIAVKSDGNPYFVFEILHGLQESPLLRLQPDGSYVTTSIIQEVEIPSTVTDLIRGRLADLEDEDRDLLDVAACCGFEFEPAVVAEAIGMRRIPLLKRLARLEERRRLVRCVGDKYVFDHHQIREIIYSNLAQPLAREYHGELGAVMIQMQEEEEGELEPAVAVTICEHLLRGGKARKAQPYLSTALEHLNRTYQQARAVTLANLALGAKGFLEGEERVATLLRMATPLNLLGRVDEGRAAVEEAVALADETGDFHLRSKSRCALGVLASSTSAYAPAMSAIEEALAIARAGGRREDEAAAIQALGNIYQLLGRHSEAREQFESAQALSRALGDRDAEAIATNTLGLIHFMLGDHDEAQRHYEEGLELARETGDRRLEANAVGNLGAISWMRGQYDETRGHWEQQLEIARAIGDRRAEARATLNLGAVLKALGRDEEARERMEGALEISQDIGNRQSEALALTNLAEFYASVGRAATAKQLIERTREMLATLGARRLEGYVLQGLGGVAEREGDLATAAARYGEALELRRASRYPSGVAQSLLALGRIHILEKRYEEARAGLEEALAIGRELKAAEIIVHATGCLALLPDASAALARAAIAENESRLPIADRMEARFVLWKATGEREHLDEAHRILVGRRDRMPSEYHESMIRNVPLHGEIESAWQSRA